MRYVCSAAALAFLAAYASTPVYGQPVVPANLTITSYQLVSSTRYSLNQWYVTYSASLANSGPAAPAITAAVKSLQPSVQVVAGQGMLHFPPVPAGGTVTSLDTFTLLVDRTANFDWSYVQWSFLNPIANAGTNQTVVVNSTVTLNASGSTNPSGAGSLSYNWAFVSRPPGSNASLSNPNAVSPTFTCDAPGTYSVQVTVNNGFGADAALVTVSTVSSPPVANAGPNQTVRVGVVVALNGSRSFSTDGQPLTYSWSFVSLPAKSTTALSAANTPAPTFIADVPGTYIIQLIVSEGQLQSQPSTVTITTANTPPVANAGPNQTVTQGALVQLNGAGSTDVDGNPLTYRWTFNSVPAGSTAVLSNPTAVNPTFTADKPGTYVAQLIVNDGIIDSQPSTVTITTNAVQAPTANAGPNQTVDHGTTVQLSGSGTDPQGFTLTYSWAMISRPAGSNATLSANNISNPTFFADLPGSYVIQLTVNNGYLSSQPSTVAVTTTNTPPIANAGPDQSVFVNTTVTLDGSKSSDPDKDPITFSWTFTTKPSGSTATLSGANTKSPTFVPDLAGTYVVQLIVSDPFASSQPATVSVSAGTQQMTVNPNPLKLYNSPGAVTISLSPTPTTAVPVNLSGFDPAVISVSPNPATVPANSSGVNVTITPVAPGNTSFTATAAGYGSASGAVTVTKPSIAIALNNGVTTVGLNHAASGTITLNAPAPPSGTTVTLSSSPSPDGAVGFSSATVSIPAGSSSAAFTLNGTQLGTAAVLASAPGYNSGSFTVQVVMLGRILLPTGLTVSPGQATNLNVQISSPAPSDGATITLTSSDPGTLSVTPATVFIQPGQTSPSTPPQISGNGFGSVNLTASAGGYTGDTESVKVIATITFSPQAVSVSAGGVATFSILLSAPAPTGGLLVNLASSNTTVATVPQDVAFGAGEQSVTAQIDGFAPGTANITGSTNSGLAGNQYFQMAPNTVLVVTVGSPTLSITTAALTAGTVGQAYSMSVSATGGTSPYKWSATGLPAGLSINASSGVISGTPTAAGPANVTIKVTDSAINPQSASVTLPLTINGAGLAITTAALTSGTAGQAYTMTMAATGGIPPYTWSATGLPSGLSINASTGVITGTPSGASSGNVTIKVTDSTTPTALTASTTLPLTINSAGLTITTTSLSAGTVGQSYSATLAATGGVPPYSWSVFGMPSGLSLNPATGAITGTPTGTSNGNITVKVTDSSTPLPQTASASIPLTINPSTLTITTKSLPNGAVASAYSATLVATGGVTPYTWTAGGLPNGLTIDPVSGAITGTPTAPGTSNLTIKVTDFENPAQSATTTLSLVITSPLLTITTTSLNSGIVGQAYNMTMTATGGTTPYSWSATGLPAGLSINASTGAITGTPTAAANASVTIKVTDSTTPTAQAASVTLTLNIAAGPLTITTTSLTSGAAGQAYSLTVAASGGTPPYTWSATGLPAGLSINASTGAITGTPTGPISSSVTIKVTDSSTPTPQTATASLSLTVAPAALTITTTSLPSGQANQAYNATLAATGGTTPYSWSATGLPAGLSINASSGAITGTPTAGSNGNVTIKVTDSTTPTALTATVSLALNIAPPPITITTTLLPTGTAGQPYNATLAATGGTPPYTWSATGLPGGLSINPSTGAITGTPTGPNSGNVTIKVTDSTTPTALTGSASLALNITPALLTITTTALNPGIAGQPYTMNMAASGGTTPYSWSATGLPSGLSINATTGAITGTPANPTSAIVNIKVTDSGSPNPQSANVTLGLTITAAPLTITTTALNAGQALQAYSQTMTATGGTTPYTWSATGLPAGLSISSAGVISGTPTAASTGSVTIKVTDSTSPTQQSTSVTLTLTIASATLTITNTSLPAGQALQAYNVTMAATGGLKPYTWSATGLPAPLSINASTGAITGTPTAPSSGNVTIKVIDSGTPTPQTASVTLALTIAPAPLTITTSSLATGAVGQAYNVTVAATGGTGAYNWSATGLPNGLSINASTGAITGTPTAPGSGNVTIKVTDSATPTPQTASATLSLTIAPAPLTITTASLASGQAGQAYNATVAATGGTTPYSWSATGLPNGLSINASTGAITGTPTGPSSGNVTIKVTDSGTPSPQTASVTLALNIAPAPLTITTTSLPAGQALQAYSATVAATGGTVPFTWSATGLPSGLSINASTGAITGTPAGPSSGNVTIKVTDSGSPTPQTASVTLALSIAPAPLTITTTSLPAGTVGQAYNQTVAATGGTPPLTWSATGLPAGLTINASSGAITGTPTAISLNTVTVKVTDSATPTAQTATAALSLTVNPAPLSITTTALASGQALQAYNQTVAATGGTTPYSWSATGLPSGLSINASTGAITGTPPGPSSGNVTIKVTDSGTPTPQTASVTLALTIAPAPLTITTTSLQNATINVPYTAPLAAQGGTGAYTWGATGLPSGLTINTSTGLISGTPQFNGTYSVVVSLSDSAAPPQTTSKTFSLQVVVPPLVITTSSPLTPAVAGTPYTATIAASGGAPPYTWSATGLPTWLTLDTGGGACGGAVGVATLCGTPTALGTFTFSMKVTDTAQQQTIQGYSLSVTPPGGGTITVSSTAVGLNLQVPITVTLNPPAPVDVNLTIASGNPAILTIGSGKTAGSAQVTVTVSAGTSTVETFVTALSNSGTVSVTASAPGYNNGAGTVTLANSGFVLSGPKGIGGAFTTFQGVQTTITVYAARLDSNGLFVESESLASNISVNVPVAVSPSSLGSLSASTVNITGGNNSGIVTFTASTTGSGGASIVASPPAGFSPAFTNPSAGATLNATIQTNGFIVPSGITVGKGLEVSETVGLTGPAPQALTVTITSTDGSKLLFAKNPTDSGQTSISVTVLQFLSQTPAFYAYGLASNGTVNYTVSAPGYGTQTSSITLGPSGFNIQTPRGYDANFAMQLGGVDAQLNIYTALMDGSGNVLQNQAVAGGQSVSANVTSGSTNVATISTSPVTIGGGASFASTTVHATGIGNSTITASSNGYGSASVVATVTNATLSCNNALTIGYRLEAPGNCLLSSPAPAGGATITLTSNSPQLQLAVNPTDPGSNSIQITVPAGTQVGSYWVYSLGSSGTATYSANSPNYVGFTDTVTLAPSGIVILPNGPTTVSLSGGSASFSVFTAQLSTDGKNTPATPQALAGNAALSVTLANGTPSVGTLNGQSGANVTVSVAAGASSANVTFGPTATGSTTISVPSQPAGFTIPGNYSSGGSSTQFTYTVQ
ncbi:MAG TPA: putative Ig domain-containing protein [Bryobacteraceae bacterium]|nr:putative Ig domain-containing protein [Bryobacteraceae bacterium]